MACKTIREARKAAGLTQNELARFMDINRATLSKYESGAIVPPIQKLQRMAIELEIDPAAFIKSYFEETFPNTSKNQFEIWQEAKKFGSDELVQQVLAYGYRVSEDEIKLINFYWNLNLEGRKKAIERIEELTEIPKYQKSPSDAQEAAKPSEGETTLKNNKSPK